MESSMKIFKDMQKSLDKKESRQKWNDYIQKIKSSVERILSYRENFPNIEGVFSEWMKARVVSLFIEHVIGNNEDQAIIKLIKPIWAVCVY